jgi:hypothetical protein
MRSWQVERRRRTRQLIELGDLVVKAGVVDLTGDDRVMIYGAMIWIAEKLKSEDGERARGVWDKTGKDGVRGGSFGRVAQETVTGSDLSDGGRRGDPTYRSAARHRAACRTICLRQKSPAHDPRIIRGVAVRSRFQ